MFCKSEKERCFAYSTSVACDRNNFILGLKVAPRNVHDSEIFSDLFQKVNELFPESKAVVVDAGYKTPAIAREILESGKLPIMPYKRPMTKKGYFKNHEYVYDEYYDCYLCPNNQVLKYSTTNRNGYREYKSNNKTRLGILYGAVEDIRHTPKGKELYRKRGETIERVFADVKEKHGMRYTQYRGLRKVSHYLTLLFACMNLKKLAMWKKKRGLLPPTTPAFGVYLSKFQKIFTLCRKLLLSCTA